MYMYTLNSLKCFSQHIVHFRFVVQIAAILLTASCVKGKKHKIDPKLEHWKTVDLFYFVIPPL